MLYSVSKFFNNGKGHKDLTRDDVVQFLDTLRKPEEGRGIVILSLRLSHLESIFLSSILAQSFFLLLYTKPYEEEVYLMIIYDW